ncbi:MAG: NAD(P)-dependent oxidoreductase [Tepidisphaeraceae bacterium]
MSSPVDAIAYPKPLRIAVTGCAGSIGMNVWRRLVEAGHEVVGVDQRVPAERPGRFVQANLVDRSACFPAFDGCDVIVHLGEIPNANNAPSPEACFSINTAIHASVLQSAVDLKVSRVVYASTCQVYGLWGMWRGPMPANVWPSRLPFDEIEPVKPINAYAASKMANETYSSFVSRRHGLGVSAFRFPVVVSMGAKHLRGWHETSGKDFAEGYWTYLLMDDAVRAIECAIARGRPGFEVYNACARRIMGTIPLRDRIAAHYPGSPPLPADWPELAAPLDCRKALEHLGWEAKLSAENLIQTDSAGK